MKEQRFVVLLQKGNVEAQEVLEITKPINETAEMEVRLAAGRERDRRNQSATGFHIPWDVHLLPVPEDADHNATEDR